VRQERLPIPRREGGHPGCLRIALVFEESRQVVLAHGPQPYAVGHQRTLAPESGE
jgi:hypothetical protein